MGDRKNILLGLIVTASMLQSEFVMAADNSESSFLPPIWPLLALILFIVVFRKKLNCVPKENFDEEDISQPTTIVSTEESVAENTAEKLDIRDSQQCQASTAKGTRCKRSNSLEDREIAIDGKDYLLTVCKQHNKPDLKPFAECIK